MPAVGTALLVSLSPYNYVNSSAILGRFAVSLIIVDSSEDLSRKVWISPPFLSFICSFIFFESLNRGAWCRTRSGSRTQRVTHSRWRSRGAGPSGPAFCCPADVQGAPDAHRPGLLSDPAVSAGPFQPSSAASPRPVLFADINRSALLRHTGLAHSP